jgi:hypothetical protein
MVSLLLEVYAEQAEEINTAETMAPEVKGSMSRLFMDFMEDLSMPAP